MALESSTPASARARSLHTLGVACALAAGAGLGAAEAPTKLVTTGISPFLISLGMVAGVFVGRWTLPAVLKGTGFVFDDLRRRPHLMVWAVLAGGLWAVANTLTVFAIRDVGLSIAFPLWNANSLIGVLWGFVFFRELRGAGRGAWVRVAGGALAIVTGAVLLGYASSQGLVSLAPRPVSGVAAALGAALLWGTMYIPYRKAYLSGMNPLSFVTVFTVGEVVTVLVLAVTFEGGWHALGEALADARPSLFWLFLGGFCWVIGDLFQQYAAKYVGIGRGIPLSNTNQLWGLAWGALVFGELSGSRPAARVLVLVGSAVMIAGAVAIAGAAASSEEHAARSLAVARESTRYGLDASEAEASLAGIAFDRLVAVEADSAKPKGWKRMRIGDAVIAAGALGVFVWLGASARRPALSLNVGWMIVLSAATLAMLASVGYLLWKRTGFA
ncbi:MAG TPA: GRP family sugar transporter [Terriglobia bacterium]|nr:GRP family sugar transporter [Terriglobia bacterium]